MTDKQDAPPLMPKFGLGDIVSITGKYAQDWCQANLMIVQVSYDHKTDLLTYSTVIAGDPLSEGMTTDWSETDFCLIERNKYNTRHALTAPAVDGVTELNMERIEQIASAHENTKDYMKLRNGEDVCYHQFSTRRLKEFTEEVIREYLAARGLIGKAQKSEMVAVHQLCHEAYEVYVQMEGGKAETCYEGYLLQEIKRMADIIVQARNEVLSMLQPYTKGE